MATSFHREYLTLVDQLEQRFPVDRWQLADVDIWPLARMELYLDMYWAQSGSARPIIRRPFPFPRLARVLRPLRNIWRSRSDLKHLVIRPKPAHAIFLGDGVSLDFVDGAWRDRFGEPLIAAFERRGLASFLMQSGGLNRLPWYRPTFAANVIAGQGYQPRFCEAALLGLPEHAGVLEFLHDHGVSAPSLGGSQIRRFASIVSATAAEFEVLLQIVKPVLAFVVTYYAGLGPAFLLACRRQGILSVDLQHCPQEGTHKAYSWSSVPARGYTTLPAVFWTWSEREAADLRTWTSAIAQPWHRSLHGGHVQVMPFLIDHEPTTIAWDKKYAEMAGDTQYEREILVALQPIAGHAAKWEALAQQINSSPNSWRWWVRRHPASAPHQDTEYSSLLSIRRGNVLIDEASSLPLPALLRHMSALVSLASGAAAEAAAFGVPAFFLSQEARGTFPRLIERNLAAVIDVAEVNCEIAAVRARPAESVHSPQPSIDGALRYLGELSPDYSLLCRSVDGRELRD